MGDMSELRGLIVVGTFISLAVLLMAWMPSEFYVTSYEERQVSVPEYWEVQEIQHFADTHNFTLTNQTGVRFEDHELGGWYFRQGWYYDSGWTSIQRYEEWWIFRFYKEVGVFFSDNEEIGIYLQKDRLNSDYASGGLDGLKYRVEFTETLSIQIWLGFNETTYSTPGAAWDMSALQVFWGINFDQQNTGYSAWDIVAMLLFYNLPGVHWVLDAVIKIPIWISIIYISYILILRAIGAIFGGGA